VEVRRVASPQIEELQPRVRPEEARVSGGALAEANPPHAEVEVTAVTPGYARGETVSLASPEDAVEYVLNDALKEIAHRELAALPGEYPYVRAKAINMLGRGVFYEVLVEREDKWVERMVVRADKTSLYTKKTVLYFDDIVLAVTIEAVTIDRTIYYTVDARGDSLLTAVEARRELEELLERVA
jgi:hypothetical protein